MKIRHSAMIIALMISLTAVLLFIVGFGPAGVKHESAADGKEQVGMAAKQLEQLLKLGEKQTDGRLDAVVKWQGAWDTRLTAEQAAEQLAEKLGLPLPKLEPVQGHNVFASEGLMGRLVGKLSVTEVDGSLYVICRVNADGSDSAELLRVQEKAGSVLLDNGVEAKWNASVQGLAPLSSEDLQPSEDSTSSAGAVNRLSLMEKEAKELHASAVDSFEDGTTVSRTYEVPSFGITTLIDGRKAGLQMGVHTDTVTGRQEVSIGSPMLTIEY
ncbi:hypothetical protein [Paenibacillus pinistramenti]|uniref:hypothetical protein n=1 Tax=Paenibacillus pinistramenti TaxID=1768003 RepID=UPI001396CDFE|nr:hypothetical protein [Paenibacillus pinistramenti]